MEKIPLGVKYASYFQELASLSTAAAKIDETNVYQPGNPNTRKIMDLLVKENTLPESHFEGLENFENFYDQITAGKSGLILMEHYSNTDLPSLLWMLENSGNEKLADLSKRIVAIAGMKLNEANPVVRSFAESFTRVVIYPTRSQQSASENAQSEEEALAEAQKAKKINLAAMRAMDTCKRNGEPILVFPSGTRYRPGHPETKRGLREIDSYLRLFDIVLLVSVNGTLLDLVDENMLHDVVGPDTVVFTGHPVIECKPFRKEFMDTLPEDTEDPKQAMIDHVMEILEKQHNETAAKLAK